jgi:hypothetical protein
MLRGKVIGNDFSATSIEQAERLNRKHGIDNHELLPLSVEKASHRIEILVEQTESELRDRRIQ